MVCGNEDLDDMREKLGKLWEELQEMSKKGFLNIEEKKYLYEFIQVLDMSACWKVYSFGGFNVEDNCPFCDVMGSKERADMKKECDTWSREEELVSVMGVPINRFCICSLHLLLRVIGFYVQWMYELFVKSKREDALAVMMVKNILLWKLHIF